MDKTDDYCYVPTLHGKRHLATPATEASRLLEALRVYHGHIFDERPKDHFIKSFIEPNRVKPVIDTDKYARYYEDAINLTQQGNGKPLKPQDRVIAPNLTCFFAACANCVKAEVFAIESPNAAWCYLMEGWYWYGLLIGRSSIKSAVTQSCEANSVKLKNDPKQKDKAVVRECWDEWQKMPFNPDGTKKYKGKAAFARDMRDKFPNLESQPVIEGWCRAWERKA